MYVILKNDVLVLDVNNEWQKKIDLRRSHKSVSEIQFFETLESAQKVLEKMKRNDKMSYPESFDWNIYKISYTSEMFS